MERLPFEFPIQTGLPLTFLSIRVSALLFLHAKKEDRSPYLLSFLRAIFASKIKVGVETLSHLKFKWILSQTDLFEFELLQIQS